MANNSNSINSYEYEGSTAILTPFSVLNTCFAVPNIEERLYENIGSTEEITVYRNPYALSPLPGSLDLKIPQFGQTPLKPKYLIKYICGIDDILVPVGQEHGTHFNLTFAAWEHSTTITVPTRRQVPRPG